jgi:signal peptidase I
MMGDNRDNSNDSRPGVWEKTYFENLPPEEVMSKIQSIQIGDPALLDKVGFVPSQNLIGPAKILFWSYDDTFKFSNPITWVTALRWQRLLNFID